MTVPDRYASQDQPISIVLTAYEHDVEDGGTALGRPSAENHWSPELARRNGSVYHALTMMLTWTSL